MPKTVYVVDTSYLLEFYGVPGFSTKPAVNEVRRRFAEANEHDNELYTTIGCILETGNHMARVPDGHDRRQLAARLREHVRSAVATPPRPWRVLPAVEPAALIALMDSFIDDGMVAQGVGLVDTQTVTEAARLRKHKGLGYAVHIWTKDHTLKSYEPDAEPNPYLG